MFHGADLDGLASEGDWIRIVYRGQSAYVHSAFVEVIPVAAKPEQAVEHAKAHTEPAPEAKHDVVAKQDAIAKPEAHHDAPKHDEPKHDAPKHDATPAPTHAAAPPAPAHVPPTPAAPAAAPAHVAPAPTPHHDAAPAAAPHAESKHEDASANLAATNARLVRAEYQLVLSQVDAGVLTSEKAVEQLIAFDRAVNFGQISPTGGELLARFPFDVAQHAAARAHKQPAHHDVAPSPIEKSPQANIAAVAPVGDESINSLAAALPNATVQKVVADLTKLATDSGAKKRDWQGEYGAADREKIIADIATIRGDVAKIDKSGLDPTKLGQFFTLVNRKLQELAPYHFQGLNILTIETKTGPKKFDYYSTCNMTSLAMSLELLGKSAANYGGDKKEYLLFAASHFSGHLTAPAAERGAVKYEGDRSGDWNSLLGLRLPDFLELAAVAEYMNAATPEEADKAQGIAKGKKIGQDLLKRLAGKFGVGMHSISVDWNKGHTDKKLDGVDDALNEFGGQRGQVEAMERLRAKADASGKDADRQKYETAHEKLEPQMHGQVHQNKKKVSIDDAIPLDRYKEAVIGQMRPLLDSGAAVMMGAWMHWTRLYSVDENGVVLQDPGSWDRHEMHVPWEEARAMGYFWTNLVFK